MAEPNADSMPAEGWYLTKARPIPGYAGSASGPEHYFRDGHSLCGRSGPEAMDNVFLGPKIKPMFAKSCKLCHRKLAAQIDRSGAEQPHISPHPDVQSPG